MQYFPLLEICTSLFIAVAVYVMMINVNMTLTLIFSGITFLLYLFVKNVSASFSYNSGRKRQKLTQAITSHITEAVNLYKIVKSFSLEDKIHSKTLDYLFRIKKINVLFAIVKNIPVSITDFVIVLFVSTYLIIDSLLIGNDIKNTLPILIFFATSLHRIYTQFF